MSRNQVGIESGSFRKLLKPARAIELVDQCYAQVQMDLGGGRFERNSHLKIFHRLGSAPCLGLKHPQCGIGIRVMGINSYRRAKLLFGVRERSLLRPEQSEVDVSVRSEERRV